MFWVAPEFWRTKQVHKRKPALPDTTDGKREKRCKAGNCNRRTIRGSACKSMAEHARIKDMEQ